MIIPTTLSFIHLALFLFMIDPINADPTDWVNEDYVNTYNYARTDTTSNARQKILRLAQRGFHTTYKMNNNHMNAPSGNPRDYLSWAPYHWPDCEWCKAPGRTHLAHPGDGAGNNTEEDPGGDDSTPELDDPEGDPEDYFDNSTTTTTTIPGRRSFFNVPFPRLQHRVHEPRLDSASIDIPSSQPIESPVLVGQIEIPIQQPQAPLGSPHHELPSPTVSLPLSNSLPITSHSTSEHVVGTHSGAQNAVKTPSCRPSPTTSMPPSATWTTCPYVGKDGQVNPDVRDLEGPDILNTGTQMAFYNSLAYAMTRDSDYSRTAVQIIKDLILDPVTGINPNVNFGQVIRGPPPTGSQGTFTGTLDWRGIIKVVNGICLLKSSGSPDWTVELDKSWKKWASDLLDWIKTSDIGQKASTRPNNHGTFVTAIRAALCIAMDDGRCAAQVITGYMDRIFPDQIGANGEQPFEAMRTRPFHYRCFNLEAMMALTKIAREVGIDLLHAKSKHGATIQNALDYTMSVGPGKESMDPIEPLVVAAAAAYGDPQGKYAAYLDKHFSDYKTNPFWFYNQPATFKSSPKARSVVWKKDGEVGTRGVSKLQCPPIFVAEICVFLDLTFCATCDMFQSFFD